MSQLCRTREEFPSSHGEGQPRTAVLDGEGGKGGIRGRGRGVSGSLNRGWGGGFGREIPMWRGRSTVVWAVMALAMALLVGPASAKSQRYNHRDPVPVIANKVFPYNNPTETYKYYSLPFCRADSKMHTPRQRLGEFLVGDRKVEASLFNVVYQKDRQVERLCKVTLEPSEVMEFAESIRENVHFELFIDDLPLVGPVGEMEGVGLLFGNYIRGIDKAKVYLYTHLSFTIGYNGDRIVGVEVSNVEGSGMDWTSVTSAKKVDISDTSVPVDVEFTYSVRWVEDPTPYAKRMAKYVDTGFLPNSFEMHWLSIINSFVLVLILTAFLAIILMRILKNDFTRYMDGQEDEIGEEESGWKLIHGDVFRFPRFTNLFAALTGAGAQLCVTTLVLLLCALLGVFRPTKRGSILTCIIILYVLTAGIAGFVSARLFRQLGGRNWVWNTIVTSLVFPGPLFVVFSFVNTVAVSQSSTAALPFYATAVIGAMWVFVAFPLTVVGAILGRNTSKDFDPPCRTNKVPRQVPKDIPWYRRSVSQMFMSGFLPFSAIYIELSYIFASVWGHQIYTLFGILILAFVLLIIVCSFITVALVYFQLAREDHRWWWRSFLSGGATGLFIYCYSFFYYFNRSNMDGMLQSSFYFGYMAIISYAFFIMLGFVGFMSSLTFVKHIYGVVKCD